MATQTDPSKAAAAPPATGVRGRQKKEDAAYTVSFLNGKGEASSRMPTDVHAVTIVASDKKATIVNLKDIPAAVLAQYAADGIRKKINFFMKDTKKTNPAEVHTIAQELIKVSKDGTVFIHKEGGGPGRSVDYDFLADVMAKTAEIKVKAGVPKAKLMTAKNREEFLVKVKSWTSAELKEKRKAWDSDVVYKNAVKIVQADRAQANLKSEKIDNEYDALSDF